MPVVLSIGPHLKESFAMEALSDHLFWDVERSGVDPEMHAAWLTHRVLEHGRWQDWQLLAAYYGKERLSQLVTGLRCIEPRSFAFCCAWFKLPPTSFRCFALMQFQNR